MPSFTNLLIVMRGRVRRAARARPVPARCNCRRSCSRSSPGSSSARPCSGIAEVDQAVEVVALLGLAFVLFLAGLEIEFDRLRGRVLGLTGLGVRAVVRDRAGRLARPRGRRARRHAAARGDHPVRDVARRARPGAQGRGRDLLDVRAARSSRPASIADFGAIILLSVFFSGEGGTGSTLLLLGALFALAAVVFVVVRGAERSMRLRADLVRLQDTTAQIRVRAALVLFVGFAALAETLGLEVILGAFIAGAIVSLVDRDEVHDASRLPAQARGDRLRLLHPGVLRDQRRALRPRRADVVGVEPDHGPDLPGRAARRARDPGDLYRRVLDGRHAAIAGSSRPRRCRSSSPRPRSASSSA